jgi:hypothetical protein
MASYEELTPENVEGLQMDRIPFPPGMNLGQKQDILAMRQSADAVLKDIQERLKQHRLQFKLEYANFITVERELVKIQDEKLRKECIDWFFSTTKTHPTYWAVYKGFVKICEGSSMGLQAMQEITKINWNIEVKDLPKPEYNPVQYLMKKEGSVLSITIQRVFKVPSNFNGGFGPYPCVHEYEIAEELERVF